MTVVLQLQSIAENLLAQQSSSGDLTEPSGIAEVVNLRGGDQRLVHKQAHHCSPAVTAVYADVEPQQMSEGVEAMRKMVGGGRR